MSDYTIVIGILAVTATLTFAWALCRAADKKPRDTDDAE